MRIIRYWGEGWGRGGEGEGYTSLSYRGEWVSLTNSATVVSSLPCFSLLYEQRYCTSDCLKAAVPFTKPIKPLHAHAALGESQCYRPVWQEHDLFIYFSSQVERYRHIVIANNC